MMDASKRAENDPYDATVSLEVARKLKSVARAFRELQEQRLLADYSKVAKWDRTKAASKVDQAKTAFAEWKSIRNEFVAQRYLVSLLSSYREG